MGCRLVERWGGQGQILVLVQGWQVPDELSINAGLICYLEMQDGDGVEPWGECIQFLAFPQIACG